MQKACPHIGGLEGTALAETLAFNIQRGEFVQVLNISEFHCMDHRSKHSLQAWGRGSLWQHTHLLCSFLYKRTNCSDAVFWGQGLHVSIAGSSGKAMVDYLLWHLPRLCVQGRNQKRSPMYSITWLNALPNGQSPLFLLPLGGHHRLHTQVSRSSASADFLRMAVWFNVMLAKSGSIASVYMSVQDSVWNNSDPGWCCASC